jgi:hypothetical protein
MNRTATVMTMAAALAMACEAGPQLDPEITVGENPVDPEAPTAGRRAITDAERDLLDAMYGEGWSDSIEELGTITMSFTAAGVTSTSTFTGLAFQVDEIPLGGGPQNLGTDLVAWSELDPVTLTVEEMFIVLAEGQVDPGVVPLVDTATDLGPWASYTDGPNVYSYLSTGGSFEIATVALGAAAPCPVPVPGVDCTQAAGAIEGTLDMMTAGIPAIIVAEGTGIPVVEQGTTPSGSATLDIDFAFDLPVVRTTARPL